MPITLPSFVAPNELIQSAWGNGVVNALDELDDEKVDLAGDEMTGTLTINPAASTGLIIKKGTEEPRLQFQSQAGSVLLDIIATATETTIDTLSSLPIEILTRVTMESQSGSNVLALSAVTDTPTLVLESVAGTDLLTMTATATNSTVASFDDLTLQANGANNIVIDGTTQRVTILNDMTVGDALTITGNLDHDGSNAGFFGTAPTTKPTVTGSRAGNAALASLLTALAGLGLLTDSSS